MLLRCQPTLPSWSKHILTSEYKCHGLSGIKLTFELRLTLIKQKRFHKKYIYPFPVQHLKTVLLQHQSRVHLEGWWTLLCSLLLRMIPSICRMLCLGCGYPSTTFQCITDKELANSAPANWNLCWSGQWKSETEMPLIVENYTWSRITIASSIQLPGSSNSEFFLSIFPHQGQIHRSGLIYSSGIYTILTAQS